MERMIEKGATYLDKLCHKFYDETKGRGKKTDYVCRLCGGPLETYYCEERLYLVKCADCGTLALVKTVNPEVSASVTLARPTLTPPNEWISVEERLPEPGDLIVYADNTVWGYQYGICRVCGKEKAFDYWIPLQDPPNNRPPEGEEDT